MTKAHNCWLFLDHVSRCSKPEVVVANHISKSNFRGMKSIMPRCETYPRRVPKALRDWVNNPKPDRDLGTKILANMSEYTRLLGWEKKRKSCWDH